MKRKSAAVIATLLVFCLLFGGCGSKTTGAAVSSTNSNAGAQEVSCPHISGTFIQSWFCSTWSDERWAQELSHYQEIGIKYIILGDTATYNKDKNQWETYYDSQIADLKNGKNYSKTLFDDALRNCQKYGMKVFIGMGLTTGYESNITNKDWLTPVMNRCNEICSELYSLYYEKYSDTFYGWYWPYEIWNDNSFSGFSENREQNIKTLADAMSICLDHLTSLNPSLPMLWSPYVNPGYMKASDTSDFWRDVIKEGHFREGDILCPMDSINNFEYKLDGKAGCKIFDIDQYEAGYRRAADDSAKGVKYWSNCETFNSKVDPAEPALWARYVCQMQTGSKYTDTIVSFAYAHYCSPYTVNKYIDDTYVNYLQNGKLETEPPEKPGNFNVKTDDNAAVLSWDASSDNIGVAGYYVYRNGTQIDQIYTKVQQPNTKLDTKSADWGFKDAIKQKGSVTYVVVAYDSAGNYSEKATRTITLDDLNKQ